MLFPNPELKITTPPHLIDEKMVSKALDELTPTSPFWMLRWLFPNTLLQNALDAAAQPDRYKHYAERSVEMWPYMIRGWGYMGLMSQAAKRGVTMEVDRLYDRLQGLSPESPGAKYEKLQRERKAAAKVVMGSQVPDFKAHALEDTAIVYTPDNINAKFYLVDFWASGAPPAFRSSRIFKRLTSIITARALRS